MASVSGSSSTMTSNYYLLNTGTSSNLQVSGLASGIDVDSIVNKLMQAESVPLDTMNQKMQLLEWKRDDYRSMSSQLSDLLNIVNTMTLQSSYTKAATVSDPTKVTVTPASGAGNGTYAISGVDSKPTLATAAMTHIQVNASQDFDASKPLIEQDSNLVDGITWTSHSVEIGSPESHAVSADGKVFNLNNGAVTKDSLSISVTDKDGAATSYTIFDSESEFNDSGEANKVLLNKTTGQLTFNNTIEQDSTIDASYEYSTVNVDLTTYDSSGNEKPIQFDANGSMSLNSILQKINSYGTVNTFYDATSKQISVAASATGDLNKSGNDITFNSSFLKTTLGLAEAVNGTDANVTVNGMPMTSSSNTFTINNTTFTLNQAISSGQTVTVGIDTDTDGMFDKIKGFVDKYNETIDKINSMTSVAPNRDYPPLTAAQKAQMSDSDITNWNEKARQGTLYSDTILNSSLSKMRQDIYSAVGGITGGSYSQIAQIGITTSQNYLEHGKLVIDESKLKSAIASDSDSVMKLFTNGNTSSSDSSSTGIAKRLFNTINDTVSKIKTQAGTVSLPNNQFYIGKSIDDLSDSISSFQDHLKMIQTRYFTQFTAMEQAIQQANSQATYIQNAFS